MTKMTEALRALRFFSVLTCIALAACKPPATDGFAERQERSATSDGPATPLESPDIEGAIWSQSATPLRLIYGKPGEPPLFAVACEVSESEPLLRFTRFAPADEGAQAFLALIGNGHVARIPVDLVEADTGLRWEGVADPEDQRMEAFSGARAVTATIPGAGMVRLNPSPLPGELVDTCRAQSEPAKADPAPPAQ
ncbi:hypothetical protein [Altererythrobacter lutimaris]|uniref:Lipoprotein n=1 Tax=Altererythrobacter lutimaris TaxID=2743979 RepID=A0A850HAM7_9SPHN|nr:hypothetical protein [Altererythrobacter lutimaris]NVE93528.1 hypothetical protein [Altererythrobacter lutimaris]